MLFLDVIVCSQFVGISKKKVLKTLKKGFSLQSVGNVLADNETVLKESVKFPSMHLDELFKWKPTTDGSFKGKIFSILVTKKLSIKVITYK